MFIYKFNHLNVNFYNNSSQKSFKGYKTLIFPPEKSNVARHYPPLDKEWKDSVCVYNKESIKNSTPINLVGNNLIEGYLNIASNKPKHRRYKGSRNTVKIYLKPRFFVAGANIKQTSDKAMFTVYVYMQENKYRLKQLFYSKEAILDKYKNILKRPYKLGKYVKKTLVSQVPFVEKVKKIEKITISKKSKKRKKSSVKAIEQPNNKILLEKVPYTNLVKNVSYKWRKFLVRFNTNLKSFYQYDKLFNTLKPLYTNKKNNLLKTFFSIFNLWLLSLLNLRVKILQFNKKENKNVKLKVLKLTNPTVNLIKRKNEKKKKRRGRINKNMGIIECKMIKNVIRENNQIKYITEETGKRKNYEVKTKEIFTIDLPIKSLKARHVKLIYETLWNFILEYLKQLSKKGNVKNYNIPFLKKHFLKKNYEKIMGISMEEETSVLRNFLRSYTNYLKFNKKTFILKTFLQSVYNKKIELNLINLKYLHLNSEIMIKNIVTKLRRQKTNAVRVLNKSLNSAILAKMSYKGVFVPKNKVNKQLKYKLDFYKGYNNLDITNFTKLSYKAMFSDFTKHIYILSNEKNKNKLTDYMVSNFNTIKYKWITGIRLEAKGRLSNRYGASRARYILKYKGNLKNLDYLEYLNRRLPSNLLLKNGKSPNVQYTYKSSERHIGTFGVKGWVNSN